MNNGCQKSNGCNADKEGGKFFKTFFYPNAQSKHVRTLAYNVLPLAVSGGFGTRNCQTKIKVKWKTKN